MYQFNKIYGKRIGLQVRKLSYSPPPVQIIDNQVDMVKSNHQLHHNSSLLKSCYRKSRKVCATFNTS